MADPVANIPLGEWLPDLPPLENPGALEARNCIAGAEGYFELKDLSSFTDALASAALGSIWFQGSDNVIYNFAGDAGALYRLTGGGTWNDVSKAGGYSVLTDQFWNFVKWGDRCIATTPGTNMQYYDTGVSALFADLPGSPPQAAQIGVVRDFIVVGDLSAFGPNFIAWSGFNSSELWTPSRATQADRQELFGRGGRVQAIVPGEYGVIVQEHSIRRMDYIGPPVIFQIDEVERSRGTPAPKSVCWTGNLVFYYGHDGFYVFNGVSSEPIGANRVNRWFNQNSDISAITSMYGAVDRRNQLVMWGFKSDAALAQNDRVIIYNWATNRWSYAEIDHQLLTEYVSSGFSLDELDGPLPAGIDIDSIGVDSNAFKGGALNLMAFNASNESATFDGPPLTAVLDTTEFTPRSGKRLKTTSQRPRVIGMNSSTTVQTGTRDVLNENVTFTPPRSLNAIGESNIRKDSRYHRYRMNVAGGFDHATGIELYGRETGRR